MVKVSKELSNSVAMVTVNTSTRSRNRLLAHYMLLAASLGFLMLTIRIVRSDKSSTGIRSKTVVRSARIQDGRPHLIYGTAWKKDETSRLVKEAVKAGFRFFDTACQPKHYDEAAVGKGLAKAMEEMKLKRADISIQTKFTPLSGQDPKNVPYHTENSIGDQAKESLMVSMKNLQVDYIDSWILHSPPKSNEDLMEVWRVMEEMANTQRVIKIGISNCYDIEVFRLLYKQAKHKPNVLQNRFYSDSKFDTELRHFCKEHGVEYQSFWTLSANKKALKQPEVIALAEAKGLTPQTYMYAFLMSLGYVSPLDGTTKLKHMTEDIAMMEKVQKGEIEFSTSEQHQMAELLGIPKL